MSDAPASHEQACSFCNKVRAEVHMLVAGPEVSICDACVELCNQIIAEARGAAEAGIEKPAGATLPSARAQDSSWRRWLRRVF